MLQNNSHTLSRRCKGKYLQNPKSFSFVVDIVDSDLFQSSLLKYQAEGLGNIDQGYLIRT